MNYNPFNNVTNPSNLDFDNVGQNSFNPYSKTNYQQPFAKQDIPYQGGYMNQMPVGMNSGCFTCPQSCPTYDCCNNVVETCNVEQVPHYINYHTHVVNNCVKRHVNVPTYSQSSEVRVINEYANPYMVNGPLTSNQVNNGGPGFNNFFLPFIL